MQLQDLGLNRFLYKDILEEDADSSIYENNSNVTNISGGAASGTEPGSIITSVILQSSPSDDRIEINPDDTFKAYNSGNVVVLIDKNGIVADNLVVENETINNSTIENATITNATIETADIETANIETANIVDAFIDNATIDVLDVTSYLFYAGIQMPQVFGAEIDDAGNIVLAPPGWLSLQISTGFYIIVHGLNNTDYNVTITPVDHHIRPIIFSKLANSFLVDFQQTVYGTATFSVDGGGGGTVDVDGVRVSPFEELADTGFNLILENNLP